MIVHIIGNTSNLTNDLPFYKAIIETLHDNGAVVARDWTSAAQEQTDKASSLENTHELWTDIYSDEAISRADVVIVEATNFGFQEGFYASQSLQQKKPLLLVTRGDLHTLPLNGIRQKLLVTARYDTVDELQKIVAKFIKSNTIATKDLRFNFFIDRQIYSYLREVSYETGKNKSEIIRELLEQEIDKQEKS